jgi:hypothetical protein
MGCQRYPTLPDDTLVIDRTASYCANCGQDANPSEQGHETKIGYGPHGPGCGIVWTKVSSSYIGDAQKESVMDMRPDLEWVDQFPGA